MGYMAFGAKSGPVIGMLIRNTSSSTHLLLCMAGIPVRVYGVYVYTAGAGGSDPSILPV